MKTVFKRLFVPCLLAAALAGGVSLYAADTKSKVDDQAAGKAKDTTEKEKGKAKRDWYPFGGIVAAVDKQAHTIALKKKEGERVLKLDSKSTLEINGKPATLADVKVGDYAHGKLHKDSAGNEVLTDAKFDKERPNQKKAGDEQDAQEKPASKTKKQ